MTKEDPTAANRKRDHIELAFKSKVKREEIDSRFYYEPVLQPHPVDTSLEKDFLSIRLKTPIWVSSMTGGTEKGKLINENLARICHDFGMGMGLGSCRSLLYSDEYLADFDVRNIIGDHLPLFGNLGIAQVEHLIADQKLELVDELVDKLGLNGLIVHINPMQEWFQSEGDLIRKAPVETISRLLDVAEYPIIVKEVGQGMGMDSLAVLLQLPLAAIDFGASGGTNFALLELLRTRDDRLEELVPLVTVGHNADEMVKMVNELAEGLGDRRLCQEIIISGGIQNFLDGYYLMGKCNLNAVYGQASAFLKHAMGSYEQLYKFVETQVEGLKMATAFLRVK